MCLAISACVDSDTFSMLGLQNPECEVSSHQISFPKYVLSACRFILSDILPSLLYILADIL